jgi:hypothetical protein
MDAAWESGVEIGGALAVSAMALCWAFEERAPRFTLGFALACLASSGYAAAIGSWPFAAVEALWSGLALRRWRNRSVCMLSHSHRRKT